MHQFESRLGNRSIPCSACFVPDRDAYVMTPGSDVCPDGWTAEYEGYLFAGDSSFVKNDWVCLDQNAEVGTAPSNGYAYWYPTEIRCGGIPCYTEEENSYVQQRELTCAVCTPDTKRKSSVFVRWGRSDCPTGSVGVYDGFAGGAYYSHTGSGASVLCMRRDATYAERSDINQAELYSTVSSTTPTICKAPNIRLCKIDWYIKCFLRCRAELGPRTDMGNKNLVQGRMQSGLHRHTEYRISSIRRCGVYFWLGYQLRRLFVKRSLSVL